MNEEKKTNCIKSQDKLNQQTPVHQTRQNGNSVSLNPKSLQPEPIQSSLSCASARQSHRNLHQNHL